HLRNGDSVTNPVLDTIADMGIKNLTLAPTALFPIHNPILKHIENGVITNIEGSMNGPIGEACTYGKLPKVATLRTHGGRVRAIEAGELKIDVAFIAAPIADKAGNANGRYGQSAFGPIGYQEADVRHAEKVVIITDNIQPHPIACQRISQVRVDYVVEVDTLGDPQQIVSLTTKVTTDPRKLIMARAVTDVLDALEIIQPGFNFQAGAGGISLAATKYLGELLEERGIVGGFGMGGGTQYLVDILRKGNIRLILEGQCFDLPSIVDLRENPHDHVEITPYDYANIHSKGNFVDDLDTVFLGATEVDTKFNVNVNTHADGKLLHGIGGHTDTAAGSRCTIITCPTFRKTNPTIVDDVITVTTPGETIDVVVSEAGIAINPKRKDLIKKAEGKGLDLKTIEELRDIGYAGANQKPIKPDFTDEVVALIEYRDGTIIDVVRRLKEE
ncbi:MAG TPA: citrate lyase subunit alpha, partial [Euryarchaeota archaeon]|nr:citrate lyase subunit alpha [Euryarchaeota archaeon]